MPLVHPSSQLAQTAIEHCRRHQPLIVRAEVVCRAWHCSDSWPCDVRATAEQVLVAAGINPRAYDEHQPDRPRPHR